MSAVFNSILDKQKRPTGRPYGEPCSKCSIRMPDKLWSAIQAAADGRGISRNEAINRAVQEWVNNN